MMFVHDNIGKLWIPMTVTKTARKILDKAGMQGYILSDLRPSQVAYLVSKNCTTVNEIALITGHSLKTAQKMLDDHYAETRIPELADSVILKINSDRAGRTKKGGQGADK